MTRTSRNAGRPATGYGSSWISILTGTLVAFGVMFLLSSIAASVLAGTDTSLSDVSRDPVVLGAGAAATIVLFQFMSYLWGGYTAGRMAGRSGIQNGLLVAVTAIVLAVITGVIGYTLADRALDIPALGLLPIATGTAIEFTIALGAAALVAMLAGAAIGGMIGERRTARVVPAPRSVDNRPAKDRSPSGQGNGSSKAKSGKKGASRR
ncbi:MAG TPA: YrzE family protein [Actinomycetota bacterium]|nr:YrzE family protein [Actinomycetota bacterium]